MSLVLSLFNEGNIWQLNDLLLLFFDDEKKPENLKKNLRSISILQNNETEQINDHLTICGRGESS